MINMAVDQSMFWAKRKKTTIASELYVKGVQVTHEKSTVLHHCQETLFCSCCILMSKPQAFRQYLRVGPKTSHEVNKWTKTQPGTRETLRESEELESKYGTKHSQILEERGTVITTTWRCQIIWFVKWS